jgi:eukaryotic-like serine/threonine-protein kinase
MTGSGDTGDVVQRIDTLVAQARVGEAGELAGEAGLHERAAELFEQACEFGRASDHAGLAGDARRALVLAALAGDEARIRRAEEAVLAEPNRARAAAAELRARGHGAIAARLLERLGDLKEAAVAYADAGLAIAAAAAYEALGQVREAARVLEAAHRADPGDHQVALRLANLLVVHRRFDAATRLLQAIPTESPLRSEALAPLAACYEALGLDDPLEALRREAVSRGVSLDAPNLGEDEESSVAKVVYGRYEILRSVASTPSARVFEAIDRISRQRVAVKQLRTEGLVGAGRDAFERLTREARALEQVRHPNVVALVELVADAGAVVTPWMRGGSLSDLMDRERVTPARAVEIASAVLSALGEAHRLGILHRDVKPSNILFDDAGVPRLADFGAAHVSDSSATATAGVIGTLAYMSPEQRFGQPATPASDVYSVGATLMEMLTGQPPPVSGQLSRPPSSCHPDLGASHDAAILALIAESPEERISSALEARHRLMTLSWPTDNRGDGLQRGGSAELEEDGDRLQPLEGDLLLDRWLGRRVRCVADTAAMRRVAQAYAAADEPGLSSVLRFDADRSCIWFEVPDGLLLAETARPLDAREAALLSSALDALHRRGVAHGSVDPRHVVLRGGSPVLVFDPQTFADATPERDISALQRLTVR